jgi:hypothetical protein
MARKGAISDLFGHVPQVGELPMEAAQPAVLPEWEVDARGMRFGLLVPPPGGHTPDTIRKQCMIVLGDARAATTVPWDATLVRRYTAGFIYWAEWLKNGEGERLLQDFKAEIDRLNPPVEQLAPNWRELFGPA